MGEYAEQVQDPRACAWEGLHQAAFEVLRQHAPPPRDLWDIGCGQGAFSKQAVEAGYQVHAVDREIQKFRVPGVHCDSLDLNEATEAEHFALARGVDRQS